MWSREAIPKRSSPTSVVGQRLAFAARICRRHALELRALHIAVELFAHGTRPSFIARSEQARCFELPVFHSALFCLAGFLGTAKKRNWCAAMRSDAILAKGTIFVRLLEILILASPPILRPGTKKLSPPI
jgi:hypothetical protein